MYPAWMGRVLAAHVLALALPTTRLVILPLLFGGPVMTAEQQLVPARRQPTLEPFSVDPRQMAQSANARVVVELQRLRVPGRSGTGLPRSPT